MTPFAGTNRIRFRGSAVEAALSAPRGAPLSRVWLCNPSYTRNLGHPMLDSAACPTLPSPHVNA